MSPSHNLRSRDSSLVQPPMSGANDEREQLANSKQRCQALEDELKRVQRELQVKIKMVNDKRNELQEKNDHIEEMNEMIKECEHEMKRELEDTNELFELMNKIIEEREDEMKHMRGEFDEEMKKLANGHAQQLANCEQRCQGLKDYLKRTLSGLQICGKILLREAFCTLASWRRMDWIFRGSGAEEGRVLVGYFETLVLDDEFRSGRG